MSATNGSYPGYPGYPDYHSYGTVRMHVAQGSKPSSWATYESDSALATAIALEADMAHAALLADAAYAAAIADTDHATLLAYEAAIAADAAYATELADAEYAASLAGPEPSAECKDDAALAALLAEPGSVWGPTPPGGAAFAWSPALQCEEDAAIAAALAAADAAEDAADAADAADAGELRHRNWGGAAWRTLSGSPQPDGTVLVEGRRFAQRDYGGSHGGNANLCGYLALTAGDGPAAVALKAELAPAADGIASGRLAPGCADRADHADHGGAAAMLDDAAIAAYALRRGVRVWVYSPRRPAAGPETGCVQLFAAADDGAAFAHRTSDVRLYHTGNHYTRLEPLEPM